MIAILLATYNGARWLGPFLQSIAAQQNEDWQLLIRDDGSTDATREILHAAARRDTRLQIVEDSAGRLGASGSFGALMRAALATDASYFAFADQDDVWLPRKLATQLGAMEHLEAIASPDLPLLVHSDLTVVDGEMRTLHRSHTQLARLYRDCSDPLALRTLLGHNFVTGCATLFNRPLLTAAAPLPSAAAMHDWWLACCAAALGQIEYIPEPLVLYRQHGANAIGADRGLLRPNRVLRAQSRIRRGVAQASALRQRLRELGVSADRPSARIVQNYVELFEPPSSPWRRGWGTYRLRVGRPEPLWRLLHAASAAMVSF